MGWYTHWFGSRYYALLYGHRDDADAAAWAEAITGRWALPSGAHVLDMACGRGRHARHFAQHGLKVTGIDLSDTGISDARRAVPEAEFQVHDMRLPYAHGTYDAVCCLFTSLGYSDSLADDQRVLHAAAEALRPGGFFTLDFMNVRVVLRDLVPSEALVREGVRFRIERFVQGNVLVKRVVVDDEGLTHRFEERVQLLEPSMLERLARNAGLEVLDITDGPVLSPFDPANSERFVLWTRKPRA